MKLCCMAVVSCFALLFSCATTPSSQTQGKTIQIDFVGFAVGNKDRGTFLPGLNKTGATMFLDVGATMSGVDLTYSDIGRCELFSENAKLTWRLDVVRTIQLNGNSRSERNLVRTNSAPFYGRAFPVGDFNFRVFLTDGRKIEKKFTLRLPNGKDPAGIRGVYNEDYSLGADSSFVAMIPRPTVMSAKAIRDTIEIDFKLVSSDAFGGWIEFFDTAKHMIATPISLIDPVTLLPKKELNHGNPMLIEGSVNTIMIDVSSIEFMKGKSVADLTLGILSISDGKQYGATGKPFVKYDYFSNSESFVIER